MGIYPMGALRAEQHGLPGVLLRILNWLDPFGMGIYPIGAVYDCSDGWAFIQLGQPPGIYSSGSRLGIIFIAGATYIGSQESPHLRIQKPE